MSDTHIALDAALKSRPDITCDDWLSEWDVANKDEQLPEKRYRIYTLIHTQPRLVCAPDAAFLLTTRGHSKVFYLEQDRATSGVHQIAASKTAGYAELASAQLHRRHFPQTTLDEFHRAHGGPKRAPARCPQKSDRGQARRPPLAVRHGSAT